MHRVKGVGLLGLMLLVLFLSACEGYSQTGARSSSYDNPGGGGVKVEASKANGTSTQDIELEGYSGGMLEADVTLAVGKGSFQIELLGEDDQVTLNLEASDGQTVSGHGQMAVDTFGEASYRVTATEAEEVAYTIEWTY